MAETKERIIGTEMEYGVVSDQPNGDALWTVPSENLHVYVADALKQLGITALGEHAYYLGNGARFYADINDKREYATPEDTSPLGTVANEIVGEHIVQEAANLYEDGTQSSVFVTKRVVDERGATWGYHANYSADAKKVKISAESLELFGVFAATRSAIFGAGALLKYGGFVIGQKSSQVETAFSGETTKNKPVVNLRNEAHANQNKWVRVHDISSDPNMSPWATATKLGAASIVLRLIENGRTMDKLRFENSITSVAQTVAYDPELKTVFPLEDGRVMTALEVTQEIIKEARSLEAEGGLSLSEQIALEEWEKAVRDIQQDSRLVADRVEWVLKLESLKRFRDRHGWGWDSPQLRAKDRQFSDLSERGMGMKLRQGVWAQHMPDTDLILHRLRHPPSTTRARLRGAVIRHHSASRCPTELKADWTTIRHGQGFVATLANPYTTTNSKVEDHFSLDIDAA